MSKQANMEEFTLYRKRMIATTIPAPPGKKIQLSSLDLLMENHHIKMVYYYRTPKELPTFEITTKLRILLSQVTSHFPVLTGRLIKNEEGKWMIRCNDAGVRIVEAFIKGSVESWLDNVDAEKEKKLIHWEDWYHIPYYWATCYITITCFEQGGMALGLSCSHLLADAFSAAQFIKAWAEKILYGKYSIPPFFHSLPNKTLGLKKAHQQPNNHLINHYKSLLESPSPFSPPKSKTVALSFTDHMVRSCIDLVRLSGPTNGLDPSPFTALATILWVCISRVKGETNGLADISIGLDTRKSLGLDQGFFGNCMVYTKVNGNEIGMDDLKQATKVIGEEIEKVNKESILDLIEWLDHCNNFSPPSMFDKDSLIFLNFENLDSYSTIFVDGYEPIRIAVYNESSFVEKGKILVLPSHPSEGNLSRIVMVTLPNNEALNLCEDKFLARFSPSILMGARYSTT